MTFKKIDLSTYAPGGPKDYSQWIDSNDSEAVICRKWIGAIKAGTCQHPHAASKIAYQAGYQAGIEEACRRITIKIMRG